jgi:serine/threonine protein kinase
VDKETKRFGPYEILAPLGAGGMGEVYRAKDKRLHREVAIKILAHDSDLDSETQRRFALEAQATSALNHPNILSIYDVGNENGTQYIVSELVDGESLRKTIQKGPVPIKKLLDISVQIADGLTAAHQLGIVHRDLKPENIIITHDGRVKILDFGLAKLTTPLEDAENQELIVKTESRVILGTVSYMSPEQASGSKEIDFRSDQFSFGLIVYEMATGKRAFTRTSPVQTLSAIVNDDPSSISSINPAIPVPLQWLVERCLSKNKVNRYAATIDLFHELQNLRDHVSEFPSTISNADNKPSYLKPILWAVLGILGVIGLLSFFLSPQSNSVDLSKYRLTPLAVESEMEDFPAWSPDGKTLAFTRISEDGKDQIFTQSLGSPVSTQVTKHPARCFSPFWSPDGTRIFYLAENNLWSVGATGGSPHLVIEDVWAATISPDEKTIAFLRQESNHTSLWISMNGAPPKEYDQPPFSKKKFYAAEYIRFSPDGKNLLVYLEGLEKFWMIPFPMGKPYRVLSNVITNNYFSFNWMPDSKRIVLAAPVQGNTGSHLLIGDTTTNTFYPITNGTTEEMEPSVSPDGTKIAFQQHEENWDLVEVPVDGSAMRNLLKTSRVESFPGWSPLGNQFVYARGIWGVDGIWLRNVQEGWERPIVTRSDFANQSTDELSFPSFSPDGQRIAYFGAAGGRSGIWLSNVAGGTPVRLASGQLPSWSPDGEWIAMRMAMKDKNVLAKVKVGTSSQPIVLSQNAMSYRPPQWSPQGDSISYAGEEGVYVVSPNGGDSHLVCRITQQQELLAAYGWSKDGLSIYMLGLQYMRLQEPGNWILSWVDIKTGKRKVISDFGPYSSDFYWIRGFSLAPDGKSFATSIDHAKADIWILEGFDRKIGVFEKLRGLFFK